MEVIKRRLAGCGLDDGPGAVERGLESFGRKLGSLAHDGHVAG
jgi:hypothetical protein